MLLTLSIYSMARKTNKRQRQSNLKRWKTCNEKEILESFFALDNSWARKTILYVRDLVWLTEEQIYKWGYERKRKLRIDSEMQTQQNLSDTNRIEKQSLAPHDYNSLVDDLFSHENLMADELSLEEQTIYDTLRDTILRKETTFKGMSEFDLLLWERIPNSDSILKPESTIEKLQKTPAKQNKIAKNFRKSSQITTNDEFLQFNFEDWIDRQYTTPSPCKRRNLKAQDKHVEIEQFNLFPAEINDVDFYDNLKNEDFRIDEPICDYNNIFGCEDMFDDRIGNSGLLFQ